MLTLRLNSQIIANGGSVLSVFGFAKSAPVFTFKSGPLPVFAVKFLPILAAMLCAIIDGPEPLGLVISFGLGHPNRSLVFRRVLIFSNYALTKPRALK